jgi:hypothetical protein
MDSASAAPPGRSGAEMSRTLWAWARLVGGAAGIAVVRATHTGALLHPERAEPIRWRALATAEPKGARRG